MTKEIREDIKKLLESNENENRTYQNLWDTTKTVLRGMFLAITAYIEKIEISQINIIMHLKLLGRQQQTKLKTKRCGEIIKIRAEISEIETKKSIQRFNEAKS
jgi:hypothetical protein